MLWTLTAVRVIVVVRCLFDFRYQLSCLKTIPAGPTEGRCDNSARMGLPGKQKTFFDQRGSDLSEYFKTISKVDPARFIQNLRVSGENRPGRAQKTDCGTTQER
jgi:hypothetical protein